MIRTPAALLRYASDSSLPACQKQLQDAAAYARRDPLNCDGCGRYHTACCCPDLWSESPAPPPLLERNAGPCDSFAAVGRSGVFCWCGWLAEQHKAAGR